MVVDVRSSGARRNFSGRRSRRSVVLAVLCLSLLIVSLDNTILNVALPVLVRDLHASTSQLEWIVDAYAVVFAGLLLVVGSQADRLGRKWVFMAGLAVFAAGSAASAFSGSAGHLIAARAFMGLGAAAIMPSTLSLLTSVFEAPEERRRAIGLWSGTSGLGIAIGPVVGGWLLAHFWWGSVFLVNVPIALLGMLAAAFFVPNSKDPRHRPADPKGAVLSTAAMALLLWGIIEAPGRGWSSPWVIASVTLALGLLAAFFVSERRGSFPMLDPSLFAHRRFSVAIVSMGMVVFTLMGMLFLATQYLQFSLGFSPLETGLRIMPIALVLVVMAPTSTVFVRRLGTKVVVAGGLLCVVAGLLMLSTTSVQGTYEDALPAFIIIGLGAGLAFAPSTDAVMGELPAARRGVGAATNSTALQTGGALGVAVFGTLLNSRYEGQVKAALSHAHGAVPAPVAGLITGSLGGALQVASHLGGSLGTELAGVARGAFVSGMDLAMTAGAAVAGLAAVTVAVFMPPFADPATTTRPG